MPFSEVIIIGSGIAALMAAEKLSSYKNVIILTKSKVTNSNSLLAQGGVATAIHEDDHWIEHFTDTMVAGCQHNDEKATQVLVENGPKYIQELINKGMLFDTQKDGKFDLAMEGAHSKERILHAGGDSTGRRLVQFMLESIKGKVKIMEDITVHDLIIHNNRCVGVLSSDQSENLIHFYGNHIILATGGCGGLYSVTSNDPTVIGEGIAMAYRAGAELTDLEFIQFHPTMLYVNHQACGLVSEAVRGEGATLVTETGKEIMDGVHKQKDLAPRDVVSRAIYREMQNGNNIFLNIKMVNDFKYRFPTITSLCERAGVSVEEGLLPVAPGAHFLMGGVKTDVYGQTTVRGLYAIGEVACTGVHGANRLASNSLLEGIVFGRILADFIINQPSFPIVTGDRNIEREVLSKQFPGELEVKRIMMEYVGIERSEATLTLAKKWLEMYIDPNDLQINVKYFTRDQLKMQNMLTTCWLIVSSALLRTESRGGHFRNDFPIERETWRQKQIIRQINKMNCVNEELVGVKES